MIKRGSIINIFNKGSILIEALLALGIGAFILTAVSSTLVLGQQTSLNTSQKQQAQLYIQEAESAIRSLWQTGWNNINLNGIYHPVINVNDWFLQEGEEDIGIYKRKIEIKQVYRDLNGDITDQVGSQDPSTLQFTITVSWDKPRYKLLTRSFYLTRYLNNTSWQEDSLTDFQDGLEDATDVTTNPGYVQLAETGGSGGWTEPTVVKYVDATSKGNGIVAINDYLYFALTSPSIEVFDIALDPQTPVSQGTFTTSSIPNNLAVGGNYLYVALENSENGLQIFDITSNPTNPPSVGLSKIESIPNGLWIQNSYLFSAVKEANKIEVYSLQDPLNPVYQGYFSTLHNTTDITGSGNYLYVAQEDQKEGIQVFNISQSVTNPVSLGTFPVFYNPNGIWLESNTLYLSLSGKRAAMYTLTYNPTKPRLLGIFITDQNSSDITAFGDYGYIGGADSWQRAIGIIYVGDSKGSSGIYFVYGEYTSSAFDAQNLVGFNRISWLGTEPEYTDILFQIATNLDNLTWDFVGPDGTESSFYESPGAIPLNSVQARYFKYKIILTGDSQVTPSVDKVYVNYSP